MATISHEPSGVVEERRRRALLLRMREMWASAAIAVIWVSVLFIGVFGPDIVNSTAGGDHSSVPVVVPVAGFASIVTWLIAKYSFRREHHD